MDANADKVETPSSTPGIMRELTDCLGINDFTVQSTQDGIHHALDFPAKPARHSPLFKMAGRFSLCTAVRPDGHRRASALLTGTAFLTVTLPSSITYCRLTATRIFVSKWR